MATLAQTVASVQAQLGCAYEHIFVDGGSTDGTLSTSKRCRVHRAFLRASAVALPMP